MTLKNQEYYISDYCKVKLNQNPSSDILVTFSPVDIPLKKFGSSHALAKTPFHLIQLNCPNNTWYIKGIPGLGNSFREAALALKNLVGQIDQSRERKIIFYGGSMGGYGAVLYGCLINADIIVATGVETIICLEGGITRYHLPGKIDDSFLTEFNLSKIIQNSTSKVFIYYGENSYSDLFCGLKIIGLSNVFVCSLRNFNHPLPSYIHETYGLTKFIEYHVCAEDIFHFQRNETGDLLEFPDIVEDLYMSIHKLEKLDDYQQQELIVRLTDFLAHQYSDNIKSHIAFCLSHLYDNMGNIRKAIEFSKQAVLFNQKNLSFLIFFTKLLFREELFSDVVQIAKDAISLDNPFWYLDSLEAVALGAEALIALKQYREAIQLLKDFRNRDISLKGKRVEKIALISSKILRKIPLDYISSDFIRIKILKKIENSHCFRAFNFDQSYLHILDELDFFDLEGVLLGKDIDHFISDISIFQAGNEIADVILGLYSPVTGSSSSGVPYSHSARFKARIKNYLVNESVSVMATLRNSLRIEIATLEFNLS